MLSVETNLEMLHCYTVQAPQSAQLCSCQLTSIFCEQKPGVDLVPLSILAAQSAILSMADQQSRLILSCLTESAMA